MKLKKSKLYLLSYSNWISSRLAQMHLNRICIIDDDLRNKVPVQERYKISLSVYTDLVWEVNQCKSTRATRFEPKPNNSKQNKILSS